MWRRRKESIAWLICIVEEGQFIDWKRADVKIVRSAAIEGGPRPTLQARGPVSSGRRRRSYFAKRNKELIQPTFLIPLSFTFGWIPYSHLQPLGYISNEELALPRMKLVKFSEQSWHKGPSLNATGTQTPVSHSGWENSIFSFSSGRWGNGIWAVKVKSWNKWGDLRNWGQLAFPHLPIINVNDLRTAVPCPSC